MQHAIGLHRIQMNKDIAFPVPYPRGGGHIAAGTESHCFLALRKALSRRRYVFADQHTQNHNHQRRLHGRPDNALQGNAGGPDNRQFRRTGHGAQPHQAAHEGAQRQVIVDTPWQGQGHVPECFQGLIVVAGVFQLGDEPEDQVQRQHHHHNQKHGTANGAHDITVNPTHGCAPPSVPCAYAATPVRIAARAQTTGTGRAPRASRSTPAPCHRRGHRERRSKGPGR